MAPSRPRAAALDDARSETSSTRDNKTGSLHQTATTAGVTKRRNNASKVKEAKAALNGTALAHSTTASAAGPTSAPAKQATTQDPSQSGISWQTLPTSVLHNYRHAYRLPVPSAYTHEHSRTVFSQGLGPQSPTAVFARRKARALAKASAAQNPKINGTSTSVAVTNPSSTTTSNAKGKEPDQSSAPSSDQTQPHQRHSAHHNHENTYPDQPVVGRVGKEDLALAVRKHFNAMALSEPDAIAKFLYRVREERKGRNLRMRFTAL